MQTQNDGLEQGGNFEGNEKAGCFKGQANRTS